MTTRDLIGLALLYGYATGLLLIAELIRRRQGYSQDFTRKIVHVGAGMSVFGVLSLFDNWYIGIIPFASFIVINYILWRYRFLESVDAQNSSPGTVYFALSISILFIAFWRTGSPDDRGYIAAAGAMAMTWGDASAAIIGKMWGRHKYTVFGSTRSLEGSLAMFVASATAMLLVLLLVPGSSFSPLSAPLGVSVSIAAAMIAALITTGAEAISPHGTDNLSVPLISGLIVFAAVMALR
ncbi:phosphatidate cytidylyltransferase [Oscillochloris sp. ZM17-4]|uniref:diacylglycerol/polyprenol kinase family protein n=1 Tax=Oscillochloris sp. ZM17-4 TaxID=2866714 RepID=UPI001C731208|nr:phosphatidate cytidylyltransferase [Oscillochloris sp. ZM17-4]MBX0327995.1 phosphatidate cytidylyltransferase [Oscillochloris sp. ZM17-4]